MTKKELNFLKEEKNNLEKNINSMLIMALGYTVDQKGYLMDQDTMHRIQFFNKNLKFSDNVQFHRNDIEFNPMENFKLMQSIIEVYLHNKDDEVRVFFIDSSSCAHIRTNEGLEHVSSSYPNYPLLGYIELIFNIEFGEDSKISLMDLHRLELLKFDTENRS